MRRDFRTLVILLVMPVLLIAIFGYAVTTEVRNSRIVLVDQSKSQLTAQLREAIDANAYFNIVEYKTDNTGFEELLQKGDAELVVIINEDYGIQILSDGSEPNLAQSRTAYLQNVILSFLQEKMGVQLAGGLTINSKMLFNPQLKSEYNFVPGIVGMIVMLICAMMTSISIVREKEMGTMEILLASPLPPLTIILAKLVPYFIVSSANIVTILALSYYVMDVPIAGSLLAYMIIFCLYVFVALSLGLLISCAVNSQLVAMLLSLLLLVPTMYFSGLAFNIDSMPVPFQVISNIVPARWFIDAARKLLIQGVEVRYVMKDAFILLVMAVVLVFISLKLFKTRLE